MCALILLHRLVPEYPVVLAANREERYARPSQPPATREGRLPFVAPRDLEGGGTWIGTNAAGVVAAVTNRAEATSDPSLPTRGALVTMALEFGSAAAARVNLLRQLGERRNGYHLLVADALDAFVIVGDAKPEVARLTPGAHLITNLHDVGVLRVGEIDAIAADAGNAPMIDTVGLLVDLLRIRAELVEGFTPNKDLGDRGTRSSTVIARGEPGQPGLFLHADGPPDHTPFEDYGALLREIDPRP